MVMINSQSPRGFCRRNKKAAGIERAAVLPDFLTRQFSVITAATCDGLTENAKRNRR
jgi:hypothetical protein